MVPGTISARLRPNGRLWRQPEFLKLWGGQTVSVMGDQVSSLALPLVAVLVLDASALEMGILAAAAWAPHLVLSLAAGLWVDRRQRRVPIMVATDLARAATLLSVPVAYWLEALTFEHLVGVAFLVGGLTVFFDVAWSTFFMRVVAREDVVDANGKLSLSRSGSYVAGPPLAGGLVQALTAPVAILADAFSFVLSALAIGRIRVHEPVLSAQPEASARARLVGGFRFVLGHPILRAGVGCTSTINFFNLGFGAIVVLFMARELELTPGTIGLILGVGAVGSVVGALVAPQVGRRVGIGPAIAIGAVLFPAPLLLFPLAGGPDELVVAMLVVGEFFAGIGVMVFDVNQNSLTFLLTPERMRPRQVAISRVFNYGVRPFGALAGGVLASVIGLRPALLLLAACTLLGVFWLIASPTLALRDPPDALA